MVMTGDCVCGKLRGWGEGLFRSSSDGGDGGLVAVVEGTGEMEGWIVGLKLEKDGF